MLLSKSKDGCNKPQISKPLFAEWGDESDGNDDSDFDDFILSEKENSSTSEEDASLDAYVSILGKLIYQSMKKCTLSPTESM